MRVFYLVMAFVYIGTGVFIGFVDKISYLQWTIPNKEIYAGLAVVYGIYRLVLWNTKYKHEK